MRINTKHKNLIIQALFKKKSKIAFNCDFFVKNQYNNITKAYNIKFYYDSLSNELLNRKEVLLPQRML